MAAHPILNYLLLMIFEKGIGKLSESNAAIVMLLLLLLLLLSLLLLLLSLLNQCKCGLRTSTIR